MAGRYAATDFEAFKRDYLPFAIDVVLGLGASSSSATRVAESAFASMRRSWSRYCDVGKRPKRPEEEWVRLVATYIYRCETR